MTIEDPEKRATDYEQILQKKLVQMQEKQFTFDIVIPLLYQLGFERIEHHGGSYEKGKDLICWRTDELGFTEIVTVQIKRFKPTSRARDCHSFMEVVNQLQQAAEEPIPTMEGLVCKPTIVYFITPYSVETRDLSSRFEKYSTLRTTRIKIIDGPLLSKLMQKHIPEVARQITGIEVGVHSSIRKYLTNQVLLRALGTHELKNISEYYCDLDVGYLDLSLISLIPELLTTTSIKRKISTISLNLLNQLFLSKDMLDFLNVRPSLKEINDWFGQKPTSSTQSTPLTRSTTVKQIDSLVNETNVLPIEISIDPAVLKYFHENRQILFDFSKRNAFVSRSDVLQILITAKDLRRKLKAVSDNLSVLRLFGFKSQPNENTVMPSLNMSVHEIIDLGINIAILGQAGAGKTTSLQIHAKKCIEKPTTYKLILYMPLAQIISQYNRSEFSKQDWHPISHFFRCILNFLQIENSKVSESDLRTTLRDERSLLIFDGLDEVIGTASWLIDAIKGIEKNYRNAQIVVSSRLSCPEIDRFDFHQIVLLPFTEEQRNSLIRKWFGEERSQISIEILKHLSDSPELAEVTKSPLLATILCVLAEYRVPLPKTEPRLYQERFRLLYGDYDIYKQSFRISSPRHLLEELSRKIAFFYHQNEKREYSYRVIQEKLGDFLGEKYEVPQILSAFNELINPCNIIVYMGSDQSLGFGHLRFQEFLTAQELIHNRSIEIGPLIYNPWWRGSLELFAQLTDDIGFVIEWVIAHGDLEKARETVERMLMVSQTKLKKYYLREIGARVQLENMI